MTLYTLTEVFTSDTRCAVGHLQSIRLYKTYEEAFAELKRIQNKNAGYMPDVIEEHTWEDTLIIGKEDTNSGRTRAEMVHESSWNGGYSQYEITEFRIPD